MSEASGHTQVTFPLIRPNDPPEKLIARANDMAMGMSNDFHDHASDVPIDSVILGSPTETPLGRARPVGLPEFGGKVRVATIHPYPDTLAGARLAGRLRGEMARHPSLVASLKGDPEEIVLRPSFSKPAEQYRHYAGLPTQVAKLRDDVLYFFSGDLAAATDTIRHDVLEVFVAERGISLDGIRARTLLCPDGTVKKILRGTDLGLGGSWPVMSLLHAYACEEMGLKTRSFVIKGDDLGALWTGSQIKTYLTWIGPLTGMNPQFKKVFISRCLLLYTEAAYKVVRGPNDAGDYTLGKANHTLPLKTAKLLPAHVREGNYKIWGIGAVLNALVRREGRWRVWKLQSANPFMARVQDTFGRLVYLPAPLGGLGLVAPKRDLTVPDYVQKIARAVSNGGRDLPPRTVNSPACVERRVSTIVSRAYPRIRAFLHSTTNVDIALEESWADACEKSLLEGKLNKQALVNAFHVNSSKVLEEQREALTSSASFLAACEGGTVGGVTEGSVWRYLHKLRRLASGLSSARLWPKLRFHHLQWFVDNSVWIPKPVVPRPLQGGAKKDPPPRVRKASF
jgi:hypothetical protein